MNDHDECAATVGTDQERGLISAVVGTGMARGRISTDHRGHAE